MRLESHYTYLLLFFTLRFGGFCTGALIELGWLYLMLYILDTGVLEYQCTGSPVYWLVTSILVGRPLYWLVYQCTGRYRYLLSGESILIFIPVGTFLFYVVYRVTRVCACVTVGVRSLSLSLSWLFTRCTANSFLFLLDPASGIRDTRIDSWARIAPTPTILCTM